jgi:hypothetical protein
MREGGFACREHSVGVSLLEDIRPNASLQGRRAVFQLAHKAVRLLSPSGNTQSPVIEEGLACIYSRRISKRLGLGFWPNGEKYLAAECLTAEFLNSRADAIK